MRDKWERDDYRASTLNRAVNSCTSFYKPVRVSSPADDFNDIYGQLQSFDLLNNPRFASEISALEAFCDVLWDILPLRSGTKEMVVFKTNAGRRMLGA